MSERTLTPVELELMHILWARGPSTVREVQEAASRPLAYTSVSTVLRILEQKEVVSSLRQGRGHIYTALVSREAYEATALNALVSSVFSGEPSLLVARLVSAVPLSAADRARIAALMGKGSGK